MPKTKSKPLSDQLVKAKSTINKKKFSKAIKILTDLIEQTPQEKTEQAFALLIKAYRNCKQFDAAETTTVKALGATGSELHS